MLKAFLKFLIGRRVYVEQVILYSRKAAVHYCDLSVESNLWRDGAFQTEYVVLPQLGQYITCTPIYKLFSSLTGENLTRCQATDKPSSVQLGESGFRTYNPTLFIVFIVQLFYF